MKKLVLMSWSDSNIAGDDWTWFVTLTIRKNGSYSVGAVQTGVGTTTYRLPGVYPLRRGRQVREAIEKLFLDDPLASEEIDWQEIGSVLSEHLPDLAREIEQSFTEDKIAEEEGERQYEAQEKLNAPINDWVHKSKWPFSPMSHHIGNAMDNARRRKMVFEYARNYLAKHGHLPTSSHTLHPDFSVQFPDN